MNVPETLRTARVRRLPMLALSLMLPFAVPSAPAEAAEIGAAAPHFELKGDTAEPVSLASLRGKVVYLDFWASWCGPCRQSFPWMNELHAKYAARGLQVLAVNLDAKDADARKFLADTPARFQLAYDAKGITPKAYGVKGMPTSYLIDREGRVVHEHAGFNASKKDEIEKAIAKQLEAK
ncbi:MAG: hypothetical protein RIS35_3698 [Pseudomonadota bacterium]|jgi:peroxiredoxin